MTFDLPHCDGNPRNSEGSFVVLKDGRILFVYTRYNGGEAGWVDGDAADLAAITSADGGKTWSDPEVLVRNDSQNVMSVSLLRLQDGRIAMMYLRKSMPEKNNITRYVRAFPANTMDCRPLIVFSADEGKTWSDPVDIAGVPFNYYVVNNDRLIQLRNGRLIVPAALHPQLGGGKVSLRGEAVFFLSDDGGVSWHQAQESCLAPKWVASGFREPGVVELADGRVMAFFRTDAGSHWKAFSSDGGETWTEPAAAPEFKAPDSPLSIKRDPSSGELNAIWNDLDPRRSVPFTPESWYRTPLVLARSTDEGVTWERHEVLENAPDHGYCYIAMLFHDRNLFLAYCCGGGDAQVLQDLRIRVLDV